MVAVDIDSFDAVPAEHVVTNGVDRMFGVEEFLQAYAHFGVLLIRDKAFEDAVLHRQSISFKEFMDNNCITLILRSFRVESVRIRNS